MKIAFSLAVALREPPMEIGFQWWFVKPTDSEICIINTPSSPDSELYARSQLPLEAILEVQISQKYKGGGFGLHFLEEGG